MFRTSLGRELTQSTPCAVLSRHSLHSSQQEKLYRDACAVLTKQSIDGHTLTHVATSVAPFIGYRHHHRGAPTGPATGGGEGGSAPADSNSDAVVHHEEGEGKGKGKEKNRLEPAAVR